MKSPMIFITVFSLFVTSCGSLAPVHERGPSSASLAADVPCKDLIKSFLGKKGDDFTEKLQAHVKIELDEKEASDFFKVFIDSKSALPEEDTLRAIFLFSRNDETTRVSLLREFHNQIEGDPFDGKNKLWTKFKAHKKKVDGHKAKLLSKERTPEGKKSALQKGELYEKIYYGCKAQVKGSPSAANDLHEAKRLTYALTVGSLGSTIATYTEVHWEEDKNMRWFNELFYTLGMETVLSVVGSKLIYTKHGLSPWKEKLPLTFLFYAVSDLGFSGLYRYLFSPGEAAQNKKLKDLQNDPHSKEKIQELIKIAEEEHLFEKHLKTTQDFFKDKKTQLPVKVSDIGHEITFDDIDVTKSRELLLEAIAEQEYKENSGMIETGSKPTDRYTYHRLYNLISLPTHIGVTLLMNDQMCMAGNPKEGFAKAVATYLGASILMDVLYFKGRKETINQ